MNTQGNPPLLTLGPRVRKSPFYDATVAAGAQAFTNYNHMYMPTSYGDTCLLYTSPSPRDLSTSRMPSSA